MAVEKRVVYGIAVEFDEDGFQNALKGIAELSKATQKLIKVGFSYASALMAAVAVESRFISQESALADAVGISIQKLEGYSMALSGVGVSLEDVAGMSKRFKDNLEAGQKTIQYKEAVASLAKLGIGLKTIQKMSSEEKFDFISDKLFDLDDSELAGDLASKIFGDKASKAFAYAVERGINAIDIRESMEINFLSKDAIEGAKDYNQAISKTFKIFRSITKQIAGLLAKYLTPIVEKFNEFIELNKDFISMNIAQFASSLGNAFEMIYVVLETIANVIITVIDAFGGLGTIIQMIMNAGFLFFLSKVLIGIKGLTVALIALVSKASLGMAGSGVLGLLKFGGILAAIGIAYLLMEDIAGWMVGKKSFAGKILGDFKSFKKEFEGLNFFEGVGKIGKSIFDYLVGLGIAIADALKPMLLEYLEQFKNMLSESWNDFKTMLSESWDSFKSILGEKFDSFIKSISGLWDSLGKTLNSFIQRLIAFFSSLNPFGAGNSVIPGVKDGDRPGLQDVPGTKVSPQPTYLNPLGDKKKKIAPEMQKFFPSGMAQTLSTLNLGNMSQVPGNEDNSRIAYVTQNYTSNVNVEANVDQGLASTVTGAVDSGMRTVVAKQASGGINV
jgi:hypothetical protein